MAKKCKGIIYLFVAVLALSILCGCADYATSESPADEEVAVAEEVTPDADITKEIPQVTESPASTEPEKKQEVRSIDDGDYANMLVYVPLNGGIKYHCNDSCSGISNAVTLPRSQAISNGYAMCRKCFVDEYGQKFYDEHCDDEFNITREVTVPDESNEAEDIAEEEEEYDSSQDPSAGWGRENFGVMTFDAPHKWWLEDEFYVLGSKYGDGGDGYYLSIYYEENGNMEDYLDSCRSQYELIADEDLNFDGYESQGIIYIDEYDGIDFLYIDQFIQIYPNYGTAIIEYAAPVDNDPYKYVDSFDRVINSLVIDTYDDDYSNYNYEEYEEEQDDAVVVYVTKYGECYHFSKDCAGPKSTPIDLSTAINHGMRPCKKCAD